MDGKIETVPKKLGSKRFPTTKPTNTMKKMKPIFDNGHGGMINGIYQTPGKRSPNWECGVLYEGMFNRWVINRLIERMDRAGLPYYHASPEITDVGLTERVTRANDIWRNDPDVYFLSVHANAGGGTGIEGFTSVGKTMSDQIAEIFLADLETKFQNIKKMRFDMTDGDRDKESDFYVLAKTMCPAILLELGFMDHRSDYADLWSTDYIDAIVETMFGSIQKILK